MLNFEFLEKDLGLVSQPHFGACYTSFTLLKQYIVGNIFQILLYQLTKLHAQAVFVVLSYLVYQYCYIINISTR